MLKRSKKITKILDTLWYTRHPARWLLWPMSWIYRLCMLIRRFYLVRFCQHTFAVPVIVVGNVSVGGVGKTPLVIAIAENMQQRGLKVGIVSRGYGSRVRSFPYEVRYDDHPRDVGDEPLLIVQKTGAPLVIAPHRVDAVDYLLQKYSLDFVISDDGLQHYRMGRTLEILVIDGMRGFGNGLCLPAGPLREPPSRAQHVDFVITNGTESLLPHGYRMDFVPGPITQLTTGHTFVADDFKEEFAGVAGIGHPQRFFDTLTCLGVKFHAYPFPDHHVFHEKELSFAEKKIIMTEKDAVKCKVYATDQMYYVPVTAQLSDLFWRDFWLYCTRSYNPVL